MNTAQLLSELEALTDRARLKRMVELGRLAAQEREPILMELAVGTVYERRLALFSCHGSRDAQRALQAAQDSSRHVFSPAGQLVALLCTEEQFIALLQTLPAARHQKLLLQWKQAGRSSAPIDGWLQQLIRENRQTEGWPILAYASSSLVREMLPRALAEGGGPAWGRLARWHSRLLGQELLRQAEASRERTPALTYRVNNVLGLLAERVANLAVRLVHELGRTTPLGDLTLQPLARSAPQEVAELLLVSQDQVRLSLTSRLTRLGLEQITALLTQRPALFPGIARAYARLDPARRQALALALMATLMSAEGTLPWTVVASLPSDLRVSEARRHLALPFFQTRRVERLPYAGLLPWDEASALLGDALRHPDAELRGQALASLIFSVRSDRGRQGELLAMLTARRNEQDPVRHRMLEGLASLPPGLWQLASLNALGQVIRDALNAADLSHPTGLAAERLVVALLPFHPQWGATWLATLVQARGQVNLGRLGDRLSKRTVQTLMPALLPVLHAWETREREGALLQALRSFGRFLKEVPELLSLLERLVRQAATPSTSVAALSLLAEQARARFALLVPQLLNKDASWATQPLVYTHLHERRQDLLTPFLGRQAFSGRFSTGRTRFVLPIGDGFARWTLHQQQIFAQTLIEVSRDAGRDMPGVIRALHQLAALPSPVRRQAASPGTFLSRLRGTVAPQEDPLLRRLTELAALETSNLALRDTALRLLGRLDTARGVPALLETLEDDRARIAIYTLRRPLLNLPPDEALRLLLQVPRDKVTVLKEVVRLIGDLPGDAAYRALLDLSEQPLHRDVRVAVLRGFWNHLNRPATWPVLLAAVSSADAALSDGLVRLPLHTLQDEYRGQALALLTALLTHPEPMVRLETLRFHTAVTDPERRILGVLLHRLASAYTEEARAAGRVIFASYTDRDAPVVAAAFSQLLAFPRALVNATHALQAAAVASRRQAAPLVRAVLQALAADPLTMQLQVDLAVSTLDWTELGEQLRRWADGHLLHPEALMGAVNALLKARNRTDVQDVETLEQQLAGAGVESRRLALAALVLSAQAPGLWTPERLERLRRYRADPSVLVASAAHFTLPAAEAEQEGNAQV